MKPKQKTIVLEQEILTTTKQTWPEGMRCGGPGPTTETEETGRQFVIKELRNAYAVAIGGTLYRVADVLTVQKVHRLIAYPDWETIIRA